MKSITYNPTGAIQSDQEAEELILQLQEHEAERNRLLDVCQKQIDKYREQMEYINQSFDKEKEYPLIMLGEYARAKANKITKTKKSYALPSGTLVWKRQLPLYKRNDKKLLEWAEAHAKEYVKETVNYKVEWNKLKRKVMVDEDTGELIGYITNDGEILRPDGLEVIPREDMFDIE